MTPLVRAMTLFGHGGAWRKNFGLPGRWGSSSSFIVCRKDYSGSRVFPQVKKRAAGNDTLQETENRNSAINSPQETQQSIRRKLAVGGKLSSRRDTPINPAYVSSALNACQAFDIFWLGGIGRYAFVSLNC